jgi:hypothetical protein
VTAQRLDVIKQTARALKVVDVRVITASDAKGLAEVLKRWPAQNPLG